MNWWRWTRKRQNRQNRQSKRRQMKWTREGRTGKRYVDDGEVAMKWRTMRRLLLRLDMQRTCNEASVPLECASYPILPYTWGSLS